MNFEIDSGIIKYVVLFLAIVFVISWLFNQPQLVALTLLGALVLFIIIVDAYLKKRKEGF
jgi:Flp pilus assembly protein TadB